MGIISFTGAEKCSSVFPTVFTKVSHFYEWIIEKTSDATYCQNPFWNLKPSPDTVTTEAGDQPQNSIDELSESSSNSPDNRIIKFKSYIIYFLITILTVNIFIK